MRWTGTDGLSLAYRLEGSDSGSGSRTLIAIHEMGGSLESFTPLVPLLAPDFRILRYDQRGAGLSETPRRPFGFAEHVGDLERVIAHSGVRPPFHFVGLAAGCAIALAFTHRHANDVAALALCAPALSVSADRRGYLENRTALAAREGMRAVVEDTLRNSYPARYRERDSRRYEEYRARFLANDPVGYGSINMAFADVDNADAIKALRAPCLLLGGEYDALRPPEQVRALVQEIPHAQCEIIDSGHIMPLQAADEMAARVQAFFSRPSPAA